MQAPIFWRTVLDGVDRLVQTRQVPGRPVATFYGIDVSHLRAMWLRQLVPFGLLTLLGSGALWLLTMRLQRSAAEAAAARVEAQSKAAVAESEQRLQLALTAATAGAWEVTPATGQFWASEQAMAIHGLPAGTPMSHERALAAVHPDDRHLVETALRNTIETGAAFRIEIRILLPDGSIRWVSSRAELKSGSPHPKLVGLAQDISERKRGEANLAFLAEFGQALAPLESSEDVARIATERIAGYFNASRCMLVDIDEAQDRAIVFHDYAADGASSLVGSYPISEVHTEQERAQIFAGRPIVIRHSSAERPAEAAARFASLGIGALVNIPHMRHGRWCFVLSVARARPTEWRDDQVELLREMATRVYLRVERARSEDRLRERNRQLDFLAHMSQRLLEYDEDEREQLESIFREIAEHLGVEMFYHYRPADVPRLMRLDKFGGITEEDRQRFATMPFGELLCGRVAETRERLFVEDLQQSTQPGSEVLHAAGATSYAGFPLVSRSKCVAASAITAAG